MSEEYRKYDDYDEFDDLSDEGLHIDWMGIIAKVLKSWKFIFVFCFIFGVLGIISALTMKKEYQATVTLAPEIAQRGSSGSLSSITSLLGLGNAQLAAGTDALNISLFPNICKSTPFLVNLFGVELVPYVSEEDKTEGVVATPVTVYDHFSGRDNPKKGLAKLFGNDEVEELVLPVDLTRLTGDQNRTVRALREAITAEVDSKNGVTSISVVTDNRTFSYQLADTVCKALQTYFIEYRTKKATDDYNHYVKLAEEAKANWEKAQRGEPLDKIEPLK